MYVLSNDIKQKSKDYVSSLLANGNNLLVEFYYIVDPEDPNDYKDRKSDLPDNTSSDITKRTLDIAVNSYNDNGTDLNEININIDVTNNNATSTNYNFISILVDNYDTAYSSKHIIMQGPVPEKTLAVSGTDSLDINIKF